MTKYSSKEEDIPVGHKKKGICLCFQTLNFNFANSLGDLGSIPGCVKPKTLKMVLDTSLLNTQQYKVCIKGKGKQFREKSSALPYTSV